MRWSVLAASMLVGLSGCMVGSAEDATTQDVADAAAAVAVDQAPLAEAVPAPAVSSDPLRNITAFHWVQRDPAKGLVIETVWDFGEDNECESSDASRHGPGQGPAKLTLHETGSGYGWGMSSSGEVVSAHAGQLDTRSASDGGGGSASWSKGSFRGIERTSWLLASVEPGEMTFITDGSAAAISIECERPFSLVTASVGRVGLLLNDGNLAGGAGASAFLIGSASVQDAAASDLPSPVVRAASASFGSHASRTILHAPTGDVEWVHQPTYPVGFAGNFFLAEGGPGPYGFTVDRVGVDFEAYWAAVWGLDGPLDLTPGLVPESVIDLPS